MAILVLHPEQVSEILDLAAELGVDPEVVLAEVTLPSRTTSTDRAR